MVFLRNLRSYLGNPSQCLRNTTTTHLTFSNSHQSSLLSSIFRRTLLLSAQFEHKADTQLIDSDNSKDRIKNTKKPPLEVLFEEAVGLSEKLDPSESEGETETKELKKKLKKLELEVRSLNENKLRRLKENKLKRLEEDSEKERGNVKKKTKRDESKPRSLHALFSNKAALDQSEKSLRVEEPIVYKELSPDMVLFASHLYREGYFKDANFLPRNKFDVTCFENEYARNFLKYAMEKFGKDNQEIAKWLSGSDLKTVALFGCPSLARKNIFSAKSLRTFFGIHEDTVCSKCVLKQSCKFVNQSIWKGDTKNLKLAVVMRVITLYALESVPPQLVVPEDMKDSVSRLLKEVLNLSQTVS